MEKVLAVLEIITLAMDQILFNPGKAPSSLAKKFAF
jgi:hypothetical protein